MVVEVVIVVVAVVDVEADVDLVATVEVLAAADMAEAENAVDTEVVVAAAVEDVMVIAKEDTGNFKFCFLSWFCLSPLITFVLLCMCRRQYRKFKITGNAGCF